MAIFNADSLTTQSVSRATICVQSPTAVLTLRLLRAEAALQAARGAEWAEAWAQVQAARNALQAAWQEEAPCAN